MQGMSERQYAVHFGPSRGAIQKAKTAERLVLYPDGRINAAASNSSGRKRSTYQGECEGEQPELQQETLHGPDRPRTLRPAKGPSLHLLPKRVAGGVEPLHPLSCCASTAPYHSRTSGTVVYQSDAPTIRSIGTGISGTSATRSRERYSSYNGPLPQFE
jgi:hypothetical protein